VNSTQLFSRRGTVFRLFSSNSCTRNWITQSTCPTDLKYAGKMHFHKRIIHPKFGCKRPNMLKVFAPYSTTTEPKLACCQPCAQTIALMRRNRVLLLDSTNINLQSSWCIQFKFSGKMHNNLKIILVNFGCTNFSSKKVMVLYTTTAQPCCIG